MSSTQKRVAVVNDLAGFGRCSLTVQMPVISAMGLQCCPVPTAILSNHCGFDHYFLDDYTARIPAYLAEWQRLGLRFDGIYTGFLGSLQQVDLVIQMIQQFAAPGAAILVDPVMGDEGVITLPYEEALCLKLRELISLADIITPNLTEAAKLCDLPYDPAPSDQTLSQMGQRLLDLGCRSAIITGIQRGNQVGNYICRPHQAPNWAWNQIYGHRRVGTGDIYSSVLLGSVLQNHSLTEAAQRAADFTQDALQYSEAQQIPLTDGIFFEPLLYRLGPLPSVE